MVTGKTDHTIKFQINLTNNRNFISSQVLTKAHNCKSLTIRTDQVTFKKLHQLMLIDYKKVQYDVLYQ